MGWARKAIGGVDSYSTTFSTDEAVLSEGGKWHNNGTLWTKVETSGGLALCTQTGDEVGDPGYNDTFAHLAGYPPNHRVELTVHASGVIGGNQEIECLLRWASASTSASGYECLFPRASQGYNVMLVRWNGPLADFTILADSGENPSLVSGDICWGQIVGNVITMGYIPISTGISDLLLTFDITTGAGAGLVHSTGNPGIGLFRRNTDGTNTFPDRFCVTAFSATALAA